MKLDSFQLQILPVIPSSLPSFLLPFLFLLIPLLLSLSFPKSEFSTYADTDLCVCVCVCVRARARAKSLQFCPAVYDPMDCSPPGSSVHGILQVRILE